MNTFSEMPVLRAMLMIMTGRTHDLAAFTALGIVVLNMTPGPLTVSTVIVALFANQIGSMVPDIDQPTAPFWRSLPAGNIFSRLFARAAGGHRFITHSVIGVVGIGYLAVLLLNFLDPILGSVDPSVVWWSFMIGYFSHLFMDMFTREGVPLLLPIPVKFGLPPFKRLRMTTGKAIETWVVFPTLILVNIALYSMNHTEVIALVKSII